MNFIKAIVVSGLACLLISSATITATAETYRQQEHAKWDAASLVWQQAHAAFLQAGEDYNQAGATYVIAISSTTDPDLIAKANEAWQQANRVWQQAYQVHLDAGTAYNKAGAEFLAKHAPIVNDAGNYAISNPMAVPIVVVNNGSVVKLQDLPNPFNKMPPFDQGPGKFAYNWGYKDKVYGYFSAIVSQEGSGKLLFEFTNGLGYKENDAAYTSVAITAKDASGVALAVFGVVSHTKADPGFIGIGLDEDGKPVLGNRPAQAIFALGGAKNSGHAHSADISLPVDWWKQVESLTFEWSVNFKLEPVQEWLVDKTQNVPSNKVYIAE